MLAAGFVTAVTWRMTPPRDPKQPQAVDAHLTKKRTALQSDEPTPGSEKALRQVIAGMTTVSLDYARMSHEASDAIRHELSRDQQTLAGLGPLKSTTYLGAGTSGDVYRASFRNGSLICRIFLGKGGAIEGLRLAAPEGPTPQDWIDAYALNPAGKDMARIILAFAKFLVVVGLGRFAGIRL